MIGDVGALHVLYATIVFGNQNPLNKIARGKIPDIRLIRAHKLDPAVHATTGQLAIKKFLLGFFRRESQSHQLGFVY